MPGRADPVLIRNRPFHLAQRDAWYADAVGLLVRAADQFASLAPGGDPGSELADLIDGVNEAFKRATQHGLAAKGGERGEFPRLVVDTEELFVDHLRTMHASAKNVKAYLMHGRLLQSFLRDRAAAADPVATYLAEVGRGDAEAMLANLRFMKHRVTVYERLRATPGEAPTHA